MTQLATRQLYDGCLGETRISATIMGLKLELLSHLFHYLY